MLTIQQAVNKIKELIEHAIVKDGVEGKNNLIRTQIPICMLHDAVKAAFIEHGVSTSRVAPAYGEHNGEQKLAGFFKFKNQDICLNPNNFEMRKEILDFDGILKGKVDLYGKEYTEHILSVNVRSQLTSAAKNFDTLYERTFAEALNLHLRCPLMVLGEFYMIPVYEYDNVLAKQRKVGFRQNKRISAHLEKYIYSFGAINGRRVSDGEEYKYERVCLLIVDFSKDEPKIYNSDEELINDGLLPKDTTASINALSFPNFVADLLSIYEHRFGAARFI